ncbi:MAG: hypothetical protein AAGA99_25155 [Actinomycetota bacterium]
MILPATPEESAELDRSAFRRRAGSFAALGLVIAAALAFVFVVERPDRDAIDVASADTAPLDSTTTVVAPVDDPVVADTSPPPDTVAADPPADAAPATTAADTGPAPATLQGVGNATVDVTGALDEGHLVLRYALAEAGVIAVLDGSGSVLSGGTIVVDGSNAASGGVIVPDLVDAVSISASTEGVWEVTALPAAALPVLGPGGSVMSGGAAAFVVDGVDQVTVSVVGACDDELVTIEQWTADELVNAIDVVGSGAVELIDRTAFISVRGTCEWSAQT